MILLLCILFGALNGIFLQLLKTNGSKEDDLNYALVGATGACTAALVAYLFLGRTYFQVSPIVLGVIFAAVCSGGLFFLLKKRRIIIS